MRQPKPWFRTSKNAWFVEHNGVTSPPRAAPRKCSSTEEVESWLESAHGNPRRLLQADGQRPGHHAEGCGHPSCPGLRPVPRPRRTAQRAGHLSLVQVLPPELLRAARPHRRQGPEADPRDPVAGREPGLGWWPAQRRDRASSGRSIGPTGRACSPRTRSATSRSPRPAAAIASSPTAERSEILATIKDKRFRDFVFALQQTGCRPSEVARLTAADVRIDLGVWVLDRHKAAKKTGKARVVYLNAAMLEMSRTLVASCPNGPLFPSYKLGRPFTGNAVRTRFRRLREKAAAPQALRLLQPTPHVRHGRSGQWRARRTCRRVAGAQLDPHGGAALRAPEPEGGYYARGG